MVNMGLWLWFGLQPYNMRIFFVGQFYKKRKNTWGASAVTWERFEQPRTLHRQGRQAREKKKKQIKKGWQNRKHKKENKTRAIEKIGEYLNFKCLIFDDSLLVAKAARARKRRR